MYWHNNDKALFLFAVVDVKELHLMLWLKACAERYLCAEKIKSMSKGKGKIISRNACYS